VFNFLLVAAPAVIAHRQLGLPLKGDGPGKRIG
jgi:hypothetical protein